MQTEVSVQSCYGGPFRLPEGIAQASPVYFLTGSNSSMRGTAQVRINHYTSVASEEDKRSMVFLQGQSMPKREKSKLVYDFTTIIGQEEANFEVGRDAGEITVRELTPLCVGKKQTLSGGKWLVGSYFIGLVLFQHCRKKQVLSQTIL